MALHVRKDKGLSIPPFPATVDIYLPAIIQDHLPAASYSYTNWNEDNLSPRQIVLYITHAWHLTFDIQGYNRAALLITQATVIAATNQPSNKRQFSIVTPLYTIHLPSSTHNWLDLPSSKQYSSLYEIAQNLTKKRLPSLSYHQNEKC